MVPILTGIQAVHSGPTAFVAPVVAKHASLVVPGIETDGMALQMLCGTRLACQKFGTQILLN